MPLTTALANVKRHDYLPFGEEISAGTGGRTSAQGYSSDGVRQKFTQKERDNETGLDYFLARHYCSMQGRFTSVDSFGGSTHNPQSLNRYSYVGNNPLAFTDPTGHMAEPWDRPILPFSRDSAPMMGQDPQQPDQPIQIMPASIVEPVRIIELGIAPEPKGWFGRALGAVGSALSAIGNVVFAAGNPGYDEDFAATYQPNIRDFYPPGNQCAIMFPFNLNTTRALTVQDLGVIGRIDAVTGTYTLTQEGVAVFNIKYIEGQIDNPFEIVKNLSDIARAEGATTLRIEGALANDRLHHILVQRYGLIQEGNKDIITIPLK